MIARLLAVLLAASFANCGTAMAAEKDANMLHEMLERYYIICVENDDEKNKTLFKADPDLTRNREDEHDGETLAHDSYFSKYGTDAEISLQDKSCSFTLHGMGHLLPALVGQMNGDGNKRFGAYSRVVQNKTGETHIFRSKEWEGEPIYYRMEATALTGEDEDASGPLIVRVVRIARAGSIDVIDVDEAEWRTIGRMEDGMVGLTGMTYGNMAMIILKGGVNYWISFYPIFYPHLAIDKKGVVGKYFFRAVADVLIDKKPLQAFVNCVEANKDKTRAKDAPELCVKNEQFFALKLDAAGTKALFNGKKITINAVTSLQEKFEISLPLKGIRNSAKVGELIGSPMPSSSCVPPRQNSNGEQKKEIKKEFESCMNIHVAVLENMLKAVTKEQERLMGKRREAEFAYRLKKREEELQAAIRSSVVFIASGAILPAVKHEQ